MNVTHSRNGSSNPTARLMLCLALIPLSMNLTGCPKQPPPPRTPEAICKQWNRDQWSGYNALVQIARQERAQGDKHHVAASVMAMGAMLKRCWPEMFEEVE